MRADSLLLVTDNMRLTHTGLRQGEGTFAFGLLLLLHHQASGVMEVVTSVVMFFCNSSSPWPNNLLFKTKSDVRREHGSVHFTF